MVAAIPVETIGCRNRGLIGFFLALISGLASLTAVMVAFRGRLRKNERANWWLLTALILLAPVVALIILA